MGGIHGTLAHEDRGDVFEAAEIKCKTCSVSHTHTHTHTSLHPDSTLGEPPCSPVANDGQLKAHSRGANQICRAVIGLRWAGGRAFISPSLSLSCWCSCLRLNDGQKSGLSTSTPGWQRMCVLVCVGVCWCVCVCCWLSGGLEPASFDGCWVYWRDFFLDIYIYIYILLYVYLCVSICL